MNTLKQYGASERFYAQATLYPELILARVISQHKELYRIVTEAGEAMAEVSGKFRFEAGGWADYPAVGDFVMVDRAGDEGGNAIIHHVLRRKSAFERVAAGTTGQLQVVAANIDKVFICMALAEDYNESRLERYLSVAWNSGATPVVVLTKADLCDELDAVVEQTRRIALGAEVIATSRQNEESYAPLLRELTAGVTGAFIGSSGVGKSTLINRLAGREVLRTSEVRQDGKGRHTTTHRELLLLPSGGIVIDTPGMRELGVDAVDLGSAFGDIDALSAQCKFHDCTHGGEPGCAVRAAIDRGALDERRLESYRKLKKEARYEGLNSREIEAEKLNAMFGSVGGMKKARDFIKQSDKRRR